MSDRPEWTVVKLRPDGSRAAEYTATEIPAPPGWIAVRAVWVYGRVDIGAFAFETGDILYEYFALDRHYNAFATFRDNGTFVGWYCNVTHPTTVTEREIHWHDLYVDIVALPDGQVLILDEDELAASGLMQADPHLHAAIVKGRDDLLELHARHQYPFSEVSRAD